MKLYKIRNWKETFEKAEWRKLRNRWWVAIPVKHDGTGFRRIMAMRNGLEVFGAWILIIQVASKCRNPGILADETGPLTARDISIKTGAPERQITTALSILTSSDIGWIIVEDYQPDCGGLAGDSPDDGIDYMTAQDTTQQQKTGREGPPATPPLLQPVFPPGLQGEKPAVLAYWQKFRLVPSIGAQDAIIARVTDLTAWQEALSFWESNHYRPESVTRILDRYDEILQRNDERDLPGNGTTSINRSKGSQIRTERDQSLRPPEPRHA